MALYPPFYPVFKRRPGYRADSLENVGAAVFEKNNAAMGVLLSCSQLDGQALGRERRGLEDEIAFLEGVRIKSGFGRGGGRRGRARKRRRREISAPEKKQSGANRNGEQPCLSHNRLLSLWKQPEFQPGSRAQGPKTALYVATAMGKRQPPPKPRLLRCSEGGAWCRLNSERRNRRYTSFTSAGSCPFSSSCARLMLLSIRS